jgi:hypothetical protein
VDRPELALWENRTTLRVKGEFALTAMPATDHRATWARWRADGEHRTIGRQLARNSSAMK